MHRDIVVVLFAESTVSRLLRCPDVDGNLRDSIIFQFLRPIYNLMFVKVENYYIVIFKNNMYICYYYSVNLSVDSQTIIQTFRKVCLRGGEGGGGGLAYFFYF